MRWGSEVSAYKRVLFLLAAVSLVLSPSTTGAGSTWLDGNRSSWNSPGMPVPTAPTISVAASPHCAELIRPVETLEDAEVANRGWRLLSTQQQHEGVRLIFGLLSFDANCRPSFYQQFVFVDGVFAGTLAPDFMLPRTDGSLTRARITSADEIRAIYDRYTPEDGLCCPSDESVVTFTIQRTPAGPVAVPQSATNLAIEPSEPEQAARAALYFSELEAEGDYDALYAWMHPNAKAVVPRSAVVGWYTNEWAQLGPGPINVTGVEFVDWTWGVTGKTYPNTAEVLFEQPFADGSVVADIVRLVQDDHGEWRWFFGRDLAFVQEQITKYSLDEVAPAAQEVGRQLTIQKAICPAGYAGSAYIDDCSPHRARGCSSEWGCHTPRPLPATFLRTSTELSRLKASA